MSDCVYISFFCAFFLKISFALFLCLYFQFHISFLTQLHILFVLDEHVHCLNAMLLLLFYFSSHHMHVIPFTHINKHNRSIACLFVVHLRFRRIIKYSVWNISVSYIAMVWFVSIFLKPHRLRLICRVQRRESERKAKVIPYAHARTERPKCAPANLFQIRTRRCDEYVRACVCVCILVCFVLIATINGLLTFVCARHLDGGKVAMGDMDVVGLNGNAKQLSRLCCQLISMWISAHIYYRFESVAVFFPVAFMSSELVLSIADNSVHWPYFASCAQKWEKKPILSSYHYSVSLI